MDEYATLTSDCNGDRLVASLSTQRTSEAMESTVDRRRADSAQLILASWRENKDSWVYLQQ